MLIFLSVDILRYFWVVYGLYLLSQSLSLPQQSNRSYAKFILAESYSSRFTTFHSSAKDSTPDISYWDSHVITVTYCTLTQCFQITRDFLQNTSHIAETLYVFSSGAVFFFNAVSEKDSVTLWAICELRDPWIRSNVKSHVNTWFAQPELLPIYSIFCVHSWSVYSGNCMRTYCMLRIYWIWLEPSHWCYCASGTNASFLGTQIKYSASCEDFIILLSAI